MDPRKLTLRTLLCRLLLAAVPGLLPLSILLMAPASAAADTLRAQIEMLASTSGFQVRGADLIGEESGGDANSRDAAHRISQLLANYNFVVTRDSKGRIAQLTIVGMRAPPSISSVTPEEIRIKRQSAEHYVEAVVQGPNGHELPLNVMVDTGASTLVLPRSMAGSLGYSADQLRVVRVQTANGITEGLTAILQSVRVGDAESARVAVTFVDDQLLGGKRLLGMSFLGRFRMTIDGSNGFLQLEKQGN